jgi:hypothetical protein
VKIANAEAALPSTGGVVDARGLQGVQVCSGTFSVGSATQSVQLLLGNVTFIVTNQVGIFQGSELKGIGANGTAASIIQAAVPGFPGQRYCNFSQDQSETLSESGTFKSILTKRPEVLE